MVGRCRDRSASREISRVVGRCRDGSTSREISSGLPGYPSVLHSEMRQSKDTSMLGCNYGDGIMTVNYAPVPILVMDRFSLFIGLGNHTATLFVCLLFCLLLFCAIHWYFSSIRPTLGAVQMFGFAHSVQVADQ